jgi:hypothetical protein
MRTLFCIIGNLRGGDLPLESYIKNFSQNTDLLLCVGNTYQESPWRNYSKYLYEIDESNEKIWENIYDEYSESWKKLDLKENVWGPFNGLRGSGMIICGLRKKLYDFLINNNVVYDRYVLSRSDHFYISDFLPDVRSNTVYIPEGEDYGGITDRFLVADHESFLKTLSNIVPFIIDNPMLYNNIEQYLKHYYQKIMNLNIVRINRTMFTIGRIDEQTRWRKPKINFPLPINKDYYIKYPEEYAKAKSI